MYKLELISFLGRWTRWKYPFFAQNDYLGQKTEFPVFYSKSFVHVCGRWVHIGKNESGNHHLTCSSVTHPNLASRGRPNPEIHYPLSWRCMATVAPDEGLKILEVDGWGCNLGYTWHRSKHHLKYKFVPPCLILMPYWHHLFTSVFIHLVTLSGIYNGNLLLIFDNIGITSGKNYLMDSIFSGKFHN